MEQGFTKMDDFIIRLLKKPSQEAKICSWVSEMKCSVIMWETLLP